MCWVFISSLSIFTLLSSSEWHEQKKSTYTLSWATCGDDLKNHMTQVFFLVKSIRHLVQLKVSRSPTPLSNPWKMDITFFISLSKLNKLCHIINNKYCLILPGYIKSRGCVVFCLSAKTVSYHIHFIPCFTIQLVLLHTDQDSSFERFIKLWPCKCR